jgi:hypothetical protein
VTRTARLVAAKNAFLPVRVAMRLPESLAGSTPEYKGSWLMRRLAELGPEAWKMAFQARESLFCAGKLSELLPADSGFWGNTIFELFGPDRAAIIRLLSALRLRHEGPEGIAGFLLAPGDAPALEPETRIDLRIVFGASRADAVLHAFRRWLSDLHVESTEEMSLDVRAPVRIFRPGARGMKKGQVLEARIRSGSADLVVDLACGPKARTGEWFDLIGRHAAASSSIEIRGWS